MPETDLNIVLKLIDQASAGIKQIMKDTTDETEKLKDTTKKANEEGEKSTKKHKDALLQARDAVRAFHHEIYVLAIAVGFVTLAMNEFAKTNKEARESMQEAQLAFSNFLVIAAKLSPLIQILGNISKSFNDMFGDKSNNDITRARDEIKNFNDDIQRQSLLFQVGALDAQEYYYGLLAHQEDVISRNKDIESSLVELSQLQAELGNKEILLAQTKFQEQIQLLNFYKSEFQKAHAGMASFVMTVAQSIQTNLSNALTGIITGAKSAKEAFSELGKLMIQTIVDFMVQKLIAWALEKTLLAGTVASSIIAGSQVAAAWAPAAIFANIASFGGAGVAAAASFGVASASALASATLLSTGLKAGLSAGKSGSFATGTPNVPSDMFAQIHKGETIVPATFADSIRKGELTLGGSNGGSSNINVNVYYPKMTNKDEVRELAAVLGQEIERQSRYARGI